jgi:hypothetical protein
MQGAIKKWNKLTPDEAPYRFQVHGFSRERNGSKRYTVTVLEGPQYETHKSMVLTVLEKLTYFDDWQITVLAFNRQIACYEDHFQNRVQGWVARALVRKIREREADWDWDWSEMRLTIMRVMWRHCHALLTENKRDVVRECRAHWLSRSFSDQHWSNINLGTKKIEYIVTRMTT